MVIAAKSISAWVRTAGLCLTLGAALGACGCTSLGKPNYAALDSHIKRPTEGGAATGQAAADNQTFYLEFRGDKKKPVMAKGTLTGPTTVQQAMQKAGAFKKFRRLNAEIQRPLPNGSIHVLPCEYDLATKRINPQFDYAVLPGDKIVVTEDTSTIINDMLDSSLGPLGNKLLGKKQKGKLPEKYKLAE
ncbi:MAG: hypothetical protein ACO1RA_22095 [Planctomycetaceae bacterium]